MLQEGGCSDTACVLCAALGLQLFPEPEYEDDEEDEALCADEDAEADEEEEGSVAGG